MEYKMYTKYRGSEPIAYRYGEPWVAMQLFMEGGFETEEEAIEDWNEYLRNKLDNISD